MDSGGIVCANCSKARITLNNKVGQRVCNNCVAFAEGGTPVPGASGDNRVKGTTLQTYLDYYH